MTFPHQNLEMEGPSVPLTRDTVVSHGGRLLSDEPLTVESAPEQWAYAASVKLKLPTGKQASARGDLTVVVEVDVQSGELGCLLVAEDWTTMVGPVPSGKGPGRHTIRLLREPGEGSTHLVFRNNTPGNRPCSFVVQAIHFSPGRRIPGDSQMDAVCDIASQTIDVGRLHAAATSSPLRNSGAINMVSVDALHERLGFPIALDYPEESRSKPFRQWRMEIDDAPIFRYLYRLFRPKRHLEFGTWQGVGACLCLEECDATVWTINLPEGELIDDRPAYSSEEVDAPRDAVPIGDATRSVYQTDAGSFIGRHYRAAGFGHRVCQIYCDSRQWDTTAYPADFFDSALVDGGHTPDVVLSDTRKALDLVRPGGLILWHDFCPDPAVFEASPAVVGVVTALTEHWSEIRASTRDAFWISPSFMLVGIR